MIRVGVAHFTPPELSSVPGFEPTLTEEMVLWRRIMESRFKFDPSKGAPASAVQALDMKYLQQRSQIESLLEASANELRQLTNGANSEVGRLDEHLAQLEQAVAQAHLDASVVELNEGITRKAVNEEFSIERLIARCL